LKARATSPSSRPVWAHDRIKLAGGEDPRLAAQILEGASDFPGNDHADDDGQGCSGQGGKDDIAPNPRSGGVHVVKRESHSGYRPRHFGDGHGHIEEIGAESRAVPLGFPDSRPLGRDYLGPGAVVFHRPRIGDRISEDSSIRGYDRHPRVDPRAQALDEGVDDLHSFPGFQWRRNCRRRYLRLSRELVREPIDVELAAGDGEVDAERYQHGNDEANLGKSEAGTDGSGHECGKDAGATANPAAGDGGRGRCSRRTDRGGGHRPQYRSAVSPS